MKFRNVKRKRPNSVALRSKLDESRRCKHDRNSGEPRLNRPDRKNSEERNCCPRVQPKGRSDGRVEVSRLSKRSSPS